MSVDHRQTAYEAQRAAWRREHPIMPFVSPEGLALHDKIARDKAGGLAAEPVSDDARLARIDAQTAEWKAKGLWAI